MKKTALILSFALLACDTASHYPGHDLGAFDYCWKLSRCRPDWFGDTFESVDDCATTHSRVLMAYVERAADPIACGLAVEEIQLCRSWLSCVELSEDLNAVNAREPPPHCPIHVAPLMCARVLR